MRTFLLKKRAAGAIALVLGSGSAASAQVMTKVPEPAINPDADNTKVNQRYEDKGGLTADQQSNEKEALETTRRIRSALTDDKSLSTYAHNVKIIWQNGEVVLKGPVRSAQEKRSVEAIASRMAGNTKVTSELEIASH